MIKKYDFIDKTVHLIRKLLEDGLPKEGTLDEMVQKRNHQLQKFIK